ncbi:MAG: hypothetical protein WC989_09595 [Micavibrio sp.]
MKQGRTPDRVHIVHRPAQDDYKPEATGGGMGAQKTAASLPSPAPQNTRATEIIRTLAEISDKLKRSEAERYELLAELREYRKSLNILEDKAEQSQKSYADLEQKIKSREEESSALTQRQARFERALKEAENKLVQASAGQNLLGSRIKDAETKHALLTQRMDESVIQQARLDRQMEKIGQDKSRMLRKVERMEEILNETQDTLKARALVLLTDQSAAAGTAFPRIAAYGDALDDSAQNNETSPWWRKSVQMQTVGMASMVIAALLLGWTINQIQQPEIPQIAILENGGVARINLEQKQWEPLVSDQAAPAQTAETTLIPVYNMEGELPSTDSSQPAGAQAVLDASDDELLAALEEDPDALAAQLNEIAPEAAAELDDVTAGDAALAADGPEEFEIASLPSEQAAPPQAPAAAKQSALEYDPLSAHPGKAFAQDPELANRIAQERGNQPLNSRAENDASLPEAVKSLQQQAFAGVPEAQHDLAAIYTAGREGVMQNFEKAAFWFRESAEGGIANAAYNLGVLHHQGLGVERDIAHALYWYREAAKRGHPEAQYNLGIAYIEGIGTEYDPALAAAFFESAANKGVIEAAYNLGLIYENGLVGGSPKPQDALLWYKVAADGNSTDAKAALLQLASSMQIGIEDVDKMADRLQSIYISNHGRRAGPSGS